MLQALLQVPHRSMTEVLLPCARDHRGHEIDILATDNGSACMLMGRRERGRGSLSED